MRRFIQVVTIVAVAVMMAASASATPITYNTNTAATQFVSSGTLTLNQNSGAAATLVFSPIGSTAVGVPSNISFGDFNLTCAGCSTQAVGTNFAVFNAFTFNLVVTDVTDGSATGRFVGTSTGGTVYSDTSTITVNWAPLQLGPGTSNALSGNFGTTYFGTTNFTAIVAQNTNSGVSTVQGLVGSTGVPEPMSFVLIGTGLLGLGLLRRRARG